MLKNTLLLVIILTSFGCATPPRPHSWVDVPNEELLQNWHQNPPAHWKEWDKKLSDDTVIVTCDYASGVCIGR